MIDKNTNEVGENDLYYSSFSKNINTGVGFPMGSSINKTQYKDIISKSLQIQKNPLYPGLTKNINAGVGFPMGSSINKTQYKDIISKSLQIQKNPLYPGLTKNINAGVGFPMGSSINKMQYKDIISKSLQIQKNPLYPGLMKNINAGFEFSMNSDKGYSKYKNLIFNKLAIPKTHIDLLRREDLHSDFSSTIIKDNNTYLQIKDTSNFINIDDVRNSYAIYDENLGFSKNDIFDFIKHSEQYPMLILEHDVGKSIFDEIQNFNIKEFITSEKLTVYKTRAKKDDFPFTNDELLRAPYDVSNGGRFDSYGISILYTAQTKEVSLLESYTDEANYYHIKKFHYDNSLKLADLSKLDKAFIKILLRPLERNNAQEYIIPRFISQCINKAGYDGFVIHSSKGKNSELNFNFFGDASYALKDIDYNLIDKEQVDLLIEKYEEN